MVCGAYAISALEAQTGKHLENATALVNNEQN